MRKRIVLATALAMFTAVIGAPFALAQTTSQTTSVTATITSTGTRTLGALTAMTFAADLGTGSDTTGAVVAAVTEVAINGANWTVTGELCAPTNPATPLAGSDCNSRNMKRLSDSALLSGSQLNVAMTGITGNATSTASTGAGGTLGSGAVTLASATQNAQTVYTDVYTANGTLSLNESGVNQTGTYVGVWKVTLTY